MMSFTDTGIPLNTTTKHHYVKRIVSTITRNDVGGVCFGQYMCVTDLGAITRVPAIVALVTVVC